MTGFLGTQFQISDPLLGGSSVPYDLLPLGNGTVVMAYGSSTLYLLDGAEGDITQVATGFTETLGEASEDPWLIATGRKSFGMLFQSRNGPATTDDELIYAQFNANGGLVGQTTLASGSIDDVIASTTDRGFFLSYEDRNTPNAATESITGFYRTDGSLIAEIDTGLSPAFSRRDVGAEAVTLAGGEVVIIDRDGNVPRFRIFDDRGTELAGPVQKTLSAVLPLRGGDFLAVTEINATAQTLTIERYTPGGAVKGKTITLATGIDGFDPGISDVSLARTESGLLVVTYAVGRRVGFSQESDIAYAVLTSSGAVLSPAALANVFRDEDQREPKLVTDADGTVLLTFYDQKSTDETFFFRNTIQGVVIEEPSSIITGSNGPDTETGTDKDDLILGLGGDDVLDGGAGPDDVRGGLGADQVSGGKGSDVVTGDAGSDTLSGGAGDDTLDGGNGDDLVNGDAGDDSASGGEGSDTLNGGAGNDTLDGGAGKDRLKGGPGNDSLLGGDGNDRVDGGGGADRVEGGEGNDALRGNGGADNLQGGEGKDTLKGGSGNDIFNDGGGNDRVDGGGGDDSIFDADGNDTLTGGAGADSFIYIDTDFGKDRITDFEFGVDLLDMGNLARSLAFSGADPIEVRELSAGVRFQVDADHWVLVVGATLSDFEEGDFIITDPFA